MNRVFPVVLLMAGGCAAAEQWYVGGGGGFGFTNQLSFLQGASSATAGFKPGPPLSFFTGQNLSPHLGGEIRYTLQFSAMKLAAPGSEQYSFGARTHAIHYDLLLRPRLRNAAVHPFVALGGGLKVYQGTGREIAFQPLRQYAILTKTREVKGLVSLGGGIEYRVSPRVTLRAEVRDYLTPVPSEVIAAVGKRQGNWLHNIVPMVGIAYSF